MVNYCKAIKVKIHYLLLQENEKLETSNQVTMNIRNKYEDKLVMKRYI